MPLLVKISKNPSESLVLSASFVKTLLRIFPLIGTITTKVLDSLKVNLDIDRLRLTKLSKNSTEILKK